MSAKHTKGPWRYEVCDAEMNARVTGKGGHFVATVWSGKARETGVVLANARLIAAAPEVTEAADALLGKLEVMNGCNPYDMEGDEAWPEFEALRAALAKARGEA
jgi:hypothetical protein